MNSQLKYSVLTAEFAHETNTFCVRPTPLESFRSYSFILGHNEVQTARQGTKTSIGAMFEMQSKYGWDLQAPICTAANPTGPVTDEAFETICNYIMQPLHAIQSDGIKTKFDGIILHLHGAMVTESYEDAEGELLSRIRDIVGNDVPIVVTLDLHGNITELMAEKASALIAVRTYPHIDFYERAIQGAELLQRAMTGEIVMRTVLVKPPMLRGLDGGKTQDGSPMGYLIQKSEVIESKSIGGVLVISICAGFTAADIYSTGPSVTATYDALTHDSSEAMGICNRFIKHIWKTRDYISSECVPIQEAIGVMSNWHYPHELLVVADVTDNPGSGHYGDATALLERMIEAKLANTVFYAIFDPQAVQMGIQIGVGNVGTITLGGRIDPNAGGGPLTLRGKVVTLSSGEFQSFGPILNGVWQTLGPSMLFRVDGIDIAVISNNAQFLDISQLISLGCDVAKKSIAVVKSKHHFRATFDPLCKQILLVDGLGLGSVILKGGAYHKVRRPVWPLDDISIDVDGIQDI